MHTGLVLKRLKIQGKRHVSKPTRILEVAAAEIQIWHHGRPMDG
jgi:hypothetical protein